jgi:hypothetical protein
MKDLHHRLLELHKALVDVERVGYERTRGRMPDGEFLKALIDDPAFAWLAPLTALIVRLDELGGDALPAEYAVEIRRLLKPDDLGPAFQRRYHEMLQKSPDALVAHGAVMQALSRSARPKS